MPKRDSHLFALRPAPGAVGEIQQLRDAPGLTGKAVRDDLLHVTLLWLGYDPPDATGLATRARAAAATVAAAPFRIVFDQLVAGDGQLLLAPSERLEHVHAFQHRLATALAVHGLRAERGWRFAPHVTLRRGSAPGPTRTVDPISWTVTDFVLIQSHRGHTEHETVGAWPLTGG